MMKEDGFRTNRPNIEEIEKELQRVKYMRKYEKTLKSTIYALITVAAVVVLVTTIFISVMHTYGHSMTPTLQDGDIVVCLRKTKLQKQDVIAFYYNNKILVKRVIATSGQWVNIDEEGNVTVDGIALEEPYVDEKALGECDIKLPYQVPEGRFFVLGDHRGVSVDSRSKVVGCVAEEQIVGRLYFRIWPIENIGKIE